ncbi:MAG: succinate--CoA ligase subunit alpha [Nanoarchaeota archaeon]|nr:succinate--CoA ligase subunit alpha [Nanoarchaeota archaeon]
MAIIIDENTKCIVQGLTGKQGSFHTKQMKEYGTKIVSGVTPGKKGEKVEGIPVFNTIKEALEHEKAEISVMFVPPKFAKDAAFEALENDLHLVIITEHIPVHDAMEIMALAKKKNKIVIGPNCPGIISPGKSKLGIMPNHIFKEGKIGVISRSGTLTYEIVNELTNSGFGQSTVIGIGGDPIIGLDFIEGLKKFEKDDDTKAVILIGEIGGNMEEKTAEFLKDYPKPVIAYIAGRTAPKGKTMGHAGAIIQGNAGTAEQKIKAFEKSGIKVAELPSEIIKMLKDAKFS